MSLAPGAKLGQYEIVAPIGAGGMGEVYRATDTKLKRQVAIKILPSALAADHERLARFQREAEVLASMNHPNIAGIYGLEDSGDMTALVMELVEGEDLSQRIARGAIPLDEALPIAKQIADALEAAHEQGIIHRDLKPANIKVRSDGTVKVLDFGLAKAMDPAGTASTNLANSPTLTSPATALGVILGTAAYMSPEQAKGRPADKRCDVWAFGCVLYEMLTAKRAFQGDDVSDTLAAVLRADPAWTALPAATSPSVRKALGRCLEKDRKRRLRDIGDVGILMEDASVPEAAAGAVADVGSRRAVYVAWSLAGVLFVGVAAAFRLQPVSELPPVRFSVTPPDDVRFPRISTPSVPILAPDGRHVVFAAVRGATPALWVRDIDAIEARLLPGTENGSYPFWAPDSRRIGFFANGAMKTTDMLGGGVRNLCPAPGPARGGSWNSSGIIVFTSANLPGLFQVSETSGPSKQVIASDAADRYRAPTFLPDGRRFLFLVFPQNEIRLGSLDSTGTTKVIDAESQAVFVPPGYLLFVRQGALIAQSFDARRGMPAGTGTPLVENIIASTTGYAAFSASRTGDLAYRTGLSAEVTLLTWFDRASGRAVRTVGVPGRYRNPLLSPDQKYVAYEGLGDDGNRDIYKLDLASGVESRVTLDPHDDVLPVWSPDSRHIAFGSNREGGMFSIYQKPSDLSATEEVLFKSTVENAVPYSWSPDGRFILHRSMNRGAYNTGILPLDGDRKSHLYQSVAFTLSNAVLSPNGRWIAYLGNSGVRFDVFIDTFPTPRGKQQVSTNGGYFPRWSADGTELFYYAADGQLTAVRVGQGAALDLGSRVPLFKVDMLNGPSTGIGFRAQYDVASDGQRFLVNVPVEEKGTQAFTIVLNWMSALTPSR
jgi:Tol biopolymer transport system component